MTYKSNKTPKLLPGRKKKTIRLSNDIQYAFIDNCTLLKLQRAFIIQWKRFVMYGNFIAIFHAPCDQFILSIPNYDLCVYLTVSKSEIIQKHFENLWVLRTQRFELRMEILNQRYGSFEGIRNQSVHYLDRIVNKSLLLPLRFVWYIVWYMFSKTYPFIFDVFYALAHLFLLWL